MKFKKKDMLKNYYSYKNKEKIQKAFSIFLFLFFSKENEKKK